METQPMMLSGSVVGQQCSRTGSGSGEAVGGRRGGGGAEASALTLVETDGRCGGGDLGQHIAERRWGRGCWRRGRLTFGWPGYCPAGWRRWSVYKEESGYQDNVVPCPGSHRLDSTRRSTSGVVEAAWVSTLVTGIGSRPVEGCRSGVAEAMCCRWMVVSNWATNNGGRVAEGSKRKLSLMFHWANSDYAFGYGNPTEGAVEVPLLPRQGALGENLVQFFGWTTRRLSTSQPS
uniref:Uncharacterized protein n=1 Tax=Oryza barthii TaxID=65489 RepID=A0A0D3GL92_9ORYZ